MGITGIMRKVITKVMNKIKKFVKEEVILCVAGLLAIGSMFWITPDKEYLGYIDWHTLILLFCLMAVMVGFQKLGFFQQVGNMLLSKVENSRQLTGILVFLPFFFSMVITNDVGLITFVPFTIVVLRIARQEKLLLPVVVLQTIAANLGSMLTPMGNPQNLYLYGKSGMSFPSFIRLMLPYTIAAGICLGIAIYLMKKESLRNLTLDPIAVDRKGFVLYTLLFLLCLLAVAKVISPVILLGVIVVVLGIYDRRIFKTVDYSLLGTFVGFFVFIGNIGRIEGFRQLLEKILSGNEVVVSVCASQIISNVPAALLLSGFTNEWESLIVGANLGGLGTLIASMASLISYKQIVRECPQEKGRYFALFTGGNIIMLGVLLVVHTFI